jgi:hypothetical protein
MLYVLVDLRGLRWNASLTGSTLSSEGPGRPARFTIHRRPSRWHFSYHCFMLFFTGGSFTNLVRKGRYIVTIECVGAYWRTQNVFSARVAIFAQPASLAAADVTKHTRQVQTRGKYKPAASTNKPAASTNKLGEFLFLSVCRTLPSFAPFKCTDFFVMCQGIINNHVFCTTLCQVLKFFLY